MEICEVSTATARNCFVEIPPCKGKKKEKHAGDITSNIVRYSPVASPPCALLLQTSSAQLCILMEYLTCRGKVMGEGKTR